MRGVIILYKWKIENLLYKGVFRKIENCYKKGGCNNYVEYGSCINCKIFLTYRGVTHVFI